MLFSSSFYTTVVSDGLHEPYLLLTNSSFILTLSDSDRECLIGSNLSKFRSKDLKASLMLFTCSLFSDKVRCFNQSKRALYGNFIITTCIGCPWINEFKKKIVMIFSKFCGILCVFVNFVEFRRGPSDD